MRIGRRIQRIGSKGPNDKKAAEAAYSLHVLIVFLDLCLSLLARPQNWAALYNFGPYAVKGLLQICDEANA
jgi:hypothetical protein